MVQERRRERARAVVFRAARGTILAFAGLLSLCPFGARADDETNPAEQAVARKDRGEHLAAERAASTDKLDDAATKHASLQIATYADSDHVSVFTPSIAASVENVTQGASIRGRYLVDVVSAASADVVSTASRRWTEVRHAGSLEASYKPKTFGLSLAGSVSSEPDYFSFGIGSEMSLELDEKNTTLQAGFGYGHDTVGRCGAENSPANAGGPSCTSFSVFSRTINRTSFNVGVTQILGRSTIGALVLDVGLESGDQSKPYRYVPMFSFDVAAQAVPGATFSWVTGNRLPERPLEQTPLVKRRLSLTGRLAHRFEGSTVRLEERVYGDTWALFASTTDAKWVFDLGRRVAFWPHARFHGQTAVSFWKLAYVSGPAPSWDLPVFRTGDRELGPLYTATGGGGLYFYLGPGADMQRMRLTIQGDGAYTQFLNDLYIKERTSFVGSLSFEAEL